MNHFNISKPLISYHKFSDRNRAEEILSLLEDGNEIALVSDAGMPGISDPGEDLVRLAYQWIFPLLYCLEPQPVCLPWCCQDYLAADLSSKVFTQGKREMERVLALLKSEERTIVLYEALTV